MLSRRRRACPAIRPSGRKIATTGTSSGADRHPGEHEDEPRRAAAGSATSSIRRSSPSTVTPTGRPAWSISRCRYATPPGPIIRRSRGTNRPASRSSRDSRPAASRRRSSRSRIEVGGVEVLAGPAAHHPVAEDEGQQGAGRAERRPDRRRRSASALDPGHPPDSQVPGEEHRRRTPGARSGRSASGSSVPPCRAGWRSAPAGCRRPITVTRAPVARDWARVVRISRRTSLRSSRVSEMSRRALISEPPERALTTRVDISTRTSRAGSRSLSCSMASSSDAPNRTAGVQPLDLGLRRLGHLGLGHHPGGGDAQSGVGRVGQHPGQLGDLLDEALPTPLTAPSQPAAQQQHSRWPARSRRRPAPAAWASRYGSMTSRRPGTTLKTTIGG